MSERLRHEILPSVIEQTWAYPNKWAVLTRTRFIGAADTPEEALALARAAGVRRPILYRVPDPNVRYYFYGANFA